MFVRGFRSSLAYSTSCGVLHHAHSFPSHRAMATKQNDKLVVHSADVLKALLSSATTSYNSAEVALLHIMKTHDFTESLLQQIMSGLSILFLNLILV